MAITTLSDVIVPELFTPYVVNRTMELSALCQSGIVANSFVSFSRMGNRRTRPSPRRPFSVSNSRYRRVSPRSTVFSPASVAWIARYDGLT